MAERKNGSDLDIFEGLAKKTAPTDDTPTPFAPSIAGSSRPVPAPLARHKTLLGMPNAFELEHILGQGMRQK